MEDAEEIGEAVETVVEQIEETANDEIRAAQERADEATREAARIADAAMASEHGKRMSSIEERLELWQAQAQTEKEELREKVRNLEEKLNSSQSLLTPPNLNPEPPIVEEMIIPPANPESADAPKEAESLETVEEITEPQKRRRKWM